jgi:hypothetical protein
MALAKIIRGTNGFQLVELTEDEQYAAISEAISKNLSLFYKTAVEVGDYLKSNELTQLYEHACQIALAVFNAVAVKGFTVLDTALAKKINEIKENGNK